MMRSQHWLALSIAVSTFLIGYCIFSPSALPQLWQMHQKESALKAQVATLKSELVSLTRQVQLLRETSKKGSDFLERIAREELGMIAKDEVVLTLSDANGRDTAHEKNLRP